MINTKYSDFLISALTEDSGIFPLKDVIPWIESLRHDIHVEITPVKLSEMGEWEWDKAQGRIRHRKNAFFTVDGIKVQTNYGAVPEWRQPIINQPEIGFLGMIAKKINGVLHFLVQGKVEPGNINNIQLSPTLQATKSNFTRRHGGKSPKYLEYFLESGKAHILLDQLQSEQGARFLHKRNRNIIIEIEDFIPSDKNFIWLTLGQIKQLMKYDNVVNMDIRTVLSGIRFFGWGDHDDLTDLKSCFAQSELTENSMLLSSIDHKHAYSSLDEIISWFTNLKMHAELKVDFIDIGDLQEWTITDDKIFHNSHRFFEVHWLNVFIENREVSQWTQPMVAPMRTGLIAFIVKKINGVYHFLVQAKLECGNFDILEFAPTVQCITGDFKDGIGTLPYVDYVLNAAPKQILFDSMQSEEGGRFFHESNRNLIVEAEEDFPVTCPSHYIWMTLNQLMYFIAFNNYLNIQARSLIAGVCYK